MYLRGEPADGTTAAVNAVTKEHVPGSATVTPAMKDTAFAGFAEPADQRDAAR